MVVSLMVFKKTRQGEKGIDVVPFLRRYQPDQVLGVYVTANSEKPNY